MVDLPNFGDRVRVWPMPGRNVQAGDTPILDGGAFLAGDGVEVTWSHSWHRKLLAGDIIFHDPRPAGTEKPAPAAPKSLDAVRDAVRATELSAIDKRAQAKAAAEAAKGLLEEADAADKAAAFAREAAAKAGRELASDMSKSAPSAKER